MRALCHECGPGGPKSIKSPKDIKKVKLYVEQRSTGPTIIYLCSRCARELGYKED